VGYKDPLDPRKLKDGWKKELANFYTNILKAMGDPGPKVTVAGIMINAYEQAKKPSVLAYLHMKR